jgi:PAS domain S-box-containing protein
VAYVSDRSVRVPTVPDVGIDRALGWLRALIANAPQGMALLDPDLRYLLVNDALIAINGVPVEQHLGRAIGDVFPEYAHLVVPLFRGVIESGRPLAGVPVRGETPAQPGVDRMWEVDVYPVDGPDGGRLGVAMSVVETTHQQRQRERLAQLQHLSAALAGAATVDRVAAIVLDDTMPDVGAEETSLVVVGADRLRLLRHTRDGVVESLLETDASSAAAAVRDERQQSVGDAADQRVRSVAYPLITPSGTIGALEWSWSRPHSIDDERAVLATAASLCAAALERARLADIRGQLATGFQHSLLPAALPEVPGLELAVRYRTSVREAHTGGDWYDAFTRPDGGVVLVVGDVVGHSTSSAAIMSELRHSLRTMLFVLGDPAAALTQVDAMLAHLTAEPEVMATVAALCFTPDLTDCAYALAGHPPPLVVDADGGARQMSPAPGALLGAHLGVAFDNAHARMEPGTVLALFTDGVIERRGEDLDRGVARLAAAVAGIAAGDPLDRAAGQIIRAVEQDGANDDAALLLARLPAAGSTRV